MSKKLDSAEVLSNVILGAIINYILVLILFGVGNVYAVSTTALFIGISFLRSYILRRLFRRVDNKRGKNNE